MNYLVKVVEEYRVPTMADADELETQFRKDGHYTVTKCVKIEKYIKATETEYVLMQTTKVFNDVKEPSTEVTITYG